MPTHMGAEQPPVRIRAQEIDMLDGGREGAAGLDGVEREKHRRAKVMQLLDGIHIDPETRRASCTDASSDHRYAAAA